MNLLEKIKLYFKNYENKKIEKELKLSKRTSQQKVKDWFKNLFYALIAALIIKTFIIEAYRIPTGSMEDTILVGDFLLGTKFLYAVSSPKYIPFTDIQLPYFRFKSFKNPEKGDVVVFEYPGERDELKPKEPVNYVKRCVGEPGDTIFVVDKILYVNGKLAPLPKYLKYINNSIRSKGFYNPNVFPKNSEFNEDNWGPYVIPRKGEVVNLTLENIDNWKTIIDREYGQHTVTIEQGKIKINGIETNKYTLTKDYYFMMGDNRDDSWDSRFWGFVPDDLIIGEALIIYWSWDPNISFADLFKLLGSVRLSRVAKLIR